MSKEEPFRRFFMPSEIARLVLGYLKSTNCVNSWKTFLTESKHLVEYYECYKEGIEYPTTIGGRTLIDVLNSKNTDVNTPSSLSNGSLQNVEHKLDELSKLMQNTQNSHNHEVNNGYVFKTPSKEIRTPKRVTLNENNKDNETNPSFGLRVTPRKALTPKRRDLSNNEESDFSGNEFGSSDSEGIQVKPDVIVEELMNRPELHEKLAEKINRVFNVDPNATLTENDFSQTNKNENLSKEPLQIVAASTSSDFVPDLLSMDPELENEIQLPDNAIEDIFNLFQAEPEVSDFLKTCAARHDTFNNYSSPLSASSPMTDSLTTPQHMNKFRSPLSTPRKLFNDAVKNLMNDLKTPDKQISTDSSPAAETPAEPMNSDPNSSDISSPLIGTELVLPISEAITNNSEQQEVQVPQVICLPASYGQFFSQPTFVIKTTAATTGVNVAVTPALDTIATTVTSSKKPKTILPKIMPRGKRADFTHLIELGEQKKAQNLRSESLGRRLLPKTLPVDQEKPKFEKSSLFTRLSRNPKRSTTRVSRSLNFNASVAKSTDKEIKVQENKESLDESNEKKSDSGAKDEKNAKKMKREDALILTTMNIDDFLSRVHNKV